MLTPLQQKLIHVARRQVGIAEEQYRLLLRNVGGVESSKDLGKQGFEAVMTTFEDMGFRSTTPGHGPSFYRDRFKHEAASPEQVHKIHELAGAGRYGLDALCLRFSAKRTHRPEQLKPQEAWNLIEMLKAAADRERVKEWENQTSDVQDEIPF